jgi:hypothetical protein
MGTAGVALIGGDAGAQTTTRAAASSTTSKLGLALIGKLEGTEVIRDATKFPGKFGEAPMLAELVKTGNLPPVERRLPEPADLMVIKPVHTREHPGAPDQCTARAHAQRLAPGNILFQGLSPRGVVDAWVPSSDALGRAARRPRGPALPGLGARFPARRHGPVDSPPRCVTGGCSTRRKPCVKTESKPG